MTAPTLLTAVLVYLCVGAAHDQIVEHAQKANEVESYNIPRQRYSHTTAADTWGQAIIWGPANVTASISWYPKTPSRHDDIKFAVNITAPIELSSGTLSGDVYLSEVKRKIFEFNYPFNCDKISIMSHSPVKPDNFPWALSKLMEKSRINANRISCASS